MMAISFLYHSLDFIFLILSRTSRILPKLEALLKRWLQFKRSQNHLEETRQAASFVATTATIPVYQEMPLADFTHKFVVQNQGYGFTVDFHLGGLLNNSSVQVVGFQLNLEFETPLQGPEIVSSYNHQAWLWKDGPPVTETYQGSSTTLQLKSSRSNFTGTIPSAEDQTVRWQLVTSSSEDLPGLKQITGIVMVLNLDEI